MNLLGRIDFVWVILTLCLIVSFKTQAESVDHQGLPPSLPPAELEVSDGWVLSDLSYVELAKNASFEDVLSLSPSRWIRVPTHNLGLGFSESHYWFRANIQGKSDQQDWVIRYSYALIDALDLRLVDEHGKVVERYIVGDTLPFSERPLLDRAFAFPVTLEEGERYQLFIRGHTKGSMQMPISLMALDQYRDQVKFEELFAVAFFSVLVAMVIYNLLIWLLVRDTGYLYYVFYLVSLLNVIALLQGWFFRFILPDWPALAETLIPFGVAFTQTVGFVFVTEFLRIKAKTGVTKKAFHLIVLISALTALSAFIIPYDVSIRLVAVSFYVCVITGILFIVYDWFKHRRREVSIFLFAWSAMFTGILLFLSASFGLLPYNLLTQHAVQIGAMLEVVILALGLAERINHERRETEFAKEQMLDAQIRSNKELDLRVKERTRDLEALTQKLELASITDSLTGLRNRRHFDQHYYQEFGRAFREQVPLSILLMDLDYFKQINDTYGHQAGDLVLEEVAKLLQSLIRRPTDSICRYGGEEFIATLANTDADGALKLAYAIHEGIRNLEVIWQDKRISLTASIGVVNCVPADNDSPASLLMQADRHLYIAKENGRDRVESGGSREA